MAWLVSRRFRTNNQTSAGVSFRHPSPLLIGPRVTRQGFQWLGGPGTAAARGKSTPHHLRLGHRQLQPVTITVRNRPDSNKEPSHSILLSIPLGDTFPTVLPRSTTTDSSAAVPSPLTRQLGWPDAQHFPNQVPALHSISELGRLHGSRLEHPFPTNVINPRYTINNSHTQHELQPRTPQGLRYRRCPSFPQPQDLLSPSRRHPQRRPSTGGARSR